MNDTPSNPGSTSDTPAEWVTSDTGPFALVPEWVVDSDVSDRAFRLYATLARYADQRGLAWPRRSVLADRLGTSVKSVDRAMNELEALGAVVVEARHDDGGQRSNLYHLRRICPHPGTRVSPPPGHPGLPPRDTGVPQNDNQVNENQGTREDILDDPSGAAAVGVEVSPDVERLATLLADLMVENGCRRPNITKSGFLDPIRLLIEKDGVDPGRVERAIRWSQADEFWRANIHSGKSLREKFDTLRQQAVRQNTKRAGSLDQVRDAAAEYLARKETA